jgi:hypothetical protein
MSPPRRSRRRICVNDPVPRRHWILGIGCFKVERPVRPVLVVMPDINTEDVLDLGAREDQQPVEARGLTWSPKIQINRVPATQAFTPSVAVAADGTVGVTYYDFRNNTDTPGLPTDYWFVRWD